MAGRDAKGKFLPGPATAGPGRTKGSKNRLPAELRKKVLAIVDQLEAEGKGLDEEARADPRWFYENFVKPLLPKKIEAEFEGELVLKWQD